MATNGESRPSIEEADSLLRDGDMDGAIEKLETVLKADPNNEDAHFGMGVACMRKVQEDLKKSEMFEKKYDDDIWGMRAIKHFQEVLKLNPERKEAKDNIDSIQKLMGLGL